MTSFKREEMVLVQGREYPVVGGRLRIAHELYKEKLSIITEVVEYQLDILAVVRATVETAAGRFTATGTATALRDSKLSSCLVEAAESRSVARALRYAGIGVETCGYEELGEETSVTDHTQAQRETRGAGNLRTVRPRSGTAKPSVPATSAQVRALEVIAKQAGIDVSTLVLRHLPGVTIGELTLQQASTLISELRGSQPPRAAEPRR